MAELVLPTRTDLDNYTVDVSLEGVTYQLTMQWNYRESAWYLTIADEAGEVLVGGIKLVIDYPLLTLAGHPDKPPGQLYAIDTSKQGLPPGLTELGERVLLLYDEAG